MTSIYPLTTWVIAAERRPWRPTRQALCSMMASDTPIEKANAHRPDDRILL